MERRALRPDRSPDGRDGGGYGHEQRSDQSAELSPSKPYLIPCRFRLAFTRRCAADFGAVGAFYGGFGFAAALAGGLALTLGGVCLLSRRWRRGLSAVLIGCGGVATSGWIYFSAIGG
jgi:hypothetical protein